MKAQRENPARRWLSFHVYLPNAIDSFLAQYMAPRLQDGSMSRHIRRFFFIRYFDEALHLRLRFLRREPDDDEIIKAWLGEMVREFSSAPGSIGPARIEEQLYDREEHYFGETIYSVYAELLNEQTSALALRLLESYYQDRTRLAALLIACLHFLMQKATTTPGELLRAVQASRSFAADVMTQSSLVAITTREEERAALILMVKRVAERAASFLGRDPAAMAIISLARRARKHGQQGEFVVTHALHLLCNKLGFSMQEEHWIYALLQSSEGVAHE